MGLFSFIASFFQSRKTPGQRIAELKAKKEILDKETVETRMALLDVIKKNPSLEREMRSKIAGLIAHAEKEKEKIRREIAEAQAESKQLGYLKPGFSKPL